MKRNTSNKALSENLSVGLEILQAQKFFAGQELEIRQVCEDLTNHPDPEICRMARLFEETQLSQIDAEREAVLRELEQRRGADLPKEKKSDSKNQAKQIKKLL